MQRYGQIYVLCVTTVRLICLFIWKRLDFLTRMGADFLTCAIERLS